MRELIVPFPDDTEVSSGQLQRFDESVVDPKLSLKIEATLYFLVYYYFYLRGTV